MHLSSASELPSASVRQIKDVIPELADAFAGMESQQERTAAAMRVFGKQGASLLPFLQQGAQGVRDLDAEFDALGGGLREDFLEATDKAGDELYRLHFALTGLKSRIALAVLPTITDWTKRLQGTIGWLNKMSRETNVLKLAWGAFAAIAIASTAKIAVGFAKMLGVLPKGGNIFTSLFKLGEIGLIILAILALVLIFEDLWVMINGGESVIGNLIESLFGVGAKQEFINEVTAAFEKMKAEVLALKPIVEEFGRLFLAIWPYAKVAIEFVAKGSNLPHVPIVLDADSGLVGSPTVDHKGIAAITAFIQPDLTPGRLVRVDSLAVKGLWRIDQVEYIGDVAGSDWYANMHCTQPKK